MPSKASFLLRILRHRLERQPRLCPYCGTNERLQRIQRKKLVLDILKCERCHLIFRWPMDTPEESLAYYQNQYTSDYPQVRLPSPAELDGWLSKNFADTPLDLAPKIRLLRAVRPSGRVLDFGCSWGYGVYQLARHGYQAVGFEISKLRAQYAREALGVEVFDDLEVLRALPAGSFDILFSNHVLEHLNNLKDALEVTAHLLEPVGLAFHVLPNFTGTVARNGSWINWIGEEHPLAPTVDFLASILPQHGFASVHFGSSPFNDAVVASLEQGMWDHLQTDGEELLVLASVGARIP